ncbi:MAG: FHA domain-containing protein [Acidobacteriota bacterium]
MPGQRQDGSESRFCLAVRGNAQVPVRRFYLEAAAAYTVGSAPDNDLHLPAAGVSRHHARLEVLPDGGAVIEDLDSRNGTWVGERRIGRAALVGGELLAFGSLASELVPLDVLVLDPGEPLGTEQLSDRLRRTLAVGAEPPLTLEAHLHRAERQAFAAALAASGGDPARAIDQLGVSRATFYRKLEELGLRVSQS